MPRLLEDFPRPPADNGRGLHGSASVGWSGGDEGYDFWIGELVAMGVQWFKVLDFGGDSLTFCKKLLDAGIFPIVRIIRKDPPPNDTPEPNPGHIDPPEEETLRRLIDAGVRYFETNNEPDLEREWKYHAMPPDLVESAKIIALNWLFDARFILEAGGFPGLPAISAGNDLDLMGALAALGRQDILLEGAWIALHNYCLNHPLNYPDDPVNRTGQPLTKEQYDQGSYTPWAWWNSEKNRADTLEEINAARAAGTNPTDSMHKDHSCFREFEYYNHLAMKYLGRSIPIISTEGGWHVGRREDPRYPRVTPESHRDQTVALFDFMQRQAPDYYFAAVPALLIESPGREMDAWQSSFWQRALETDEQDGLPPIAVAGADLGNRLPVIDAVKAMPNVARRLPGYQPAPPVAEVPAPPVSTKTGSATIKYVVMPGDTLSKIAQQFGTSWQTIAALNQILTPNLIRPGQTLVIPILDAGEKPIAIPESPPPDLIREPIPERTAEPSEPAPDVALVEQELFQETLEHVPPEPRDEIPARGIEAAAAPTAPPEEFEETAAPRLHPGRSQTLPQTPRDRGARPQAGDRGIGAPADRDLQWDPRLEAFNLGLYPTEVKPSRMFWKLIRADYHGPESSQGDHNIYFTILDEHRRPLANQKVWQGWQAHKVNAMTNEKGQARIPLSSVYDPERPESNLYFAWVDGLPGDRVAGVDSPLTQNASFHLTWQRASAK